jgi:hypothetical protein
MTVVVNKNLHDLLRHLEEQLLDPEFRKDSQRVSALLAEGFQEFGTSGKQWNKDSILPLLASEETGPVPRIEDFAMQPLGPRAALVTYRSMRKDAQSDTTVTSLRSSIWVESDAAWQILFHQGTRVPESL